MRQSGFSLLELIVVVVIMAGVVAVATPRFATAFDMLQLRGSAQGIAATLRSCRELAVREARVTEFTIDARTESYRASTLHLDVDWPDSTFVQGDGPYIQDLYTVRFYPDGSASGGSVLVKSGGRQYEISIDWLTGRVRIG